MRQEGFVICSHCDALVHDGEAMAEGGAEAIRRVYRGMHSPDAVDAEAQEAQLDMMKGDADGDLERWRRGMRKWLTLMPVTHPAYVPHWARDAVSFARWVEECVDGGALAKTDPLVRAAQQALGQSSIRGEDLLGSARRYFEACRELTRVTFAATLREHPHARWLHERSEKDVAADTFRMGVRASATMLPRGALAEIFVEVLGDRRVASDAVCSTCGGPREEDGEACRWCGALRVAEHDPALSTLQGLVDSLVERGESDAAVASAILSLQIAPAWNGHSLPHGDAILGVVESVAPWVGRDALLQAATGLSYMEDATVTTYVAQASRALKDWIPRGARPARRAPAESS